ncbi:MAG: HAMP domain-containing sensor histidine kinase [Erysipelotrichaceae bacterium]|nr:HAMP domain-containing sensor histidine kinase [Erysipelotrichaceae bacterium]
MKKSSKLMKRKIIFIFILAFLFSLFLLTTIFATNAYQDGFYDNDSFEKTTLCGQIMNDYYRELSSNISDYYKNNPNGKITQDDISSYLMPYESEKSNFLFLVYDENQKLLIQNTAELTMINHVTKRINIAEGKNFTISYSLAEQITGNDRLAQAHIYFINYYPLRWLVLTSGIVSFFISLASFIYLLCLAGHEDDTDEIKVRLADKVPLELFFGFVVLATIIIMQYGASIIYYFELWEFLLYFYPVLLIYGFILLAFCMSIATRYKAHKLFRYTVVYWFFNLTYQFFANIKLLNQALIMFGIYGFFIVFFPDMWILTTFIFVIYMFYVIVRSIIQLERLFVGGKKLAEGDFNYKIDTRFMKWKFKQHALDLNHIRVGMSKAVENQMRSERLKTELITNVSHDLKTPLTSIINYVDLLKKEDLNNPVALEYLDVLDRQSKKLKKLTEDLVEASKAATGNIQVNFERIDIVEFMDQAAGEYSETFQQKGLNTVINAHEKPLFVSADGELLWRVFDNLFTNISKYAQENTRIYIDIKRNDQTAIVALKNVSCDPLNITADELLERFVRGDVSRTTDGSGLGLSITKSLLELQKAKFNLEIDGDLFKSEIIFDLIP